MNETQLVVFDIANFTCGIDIKRVKEINRKVEINRVSTAPDYVKGVINLRGDIVTIIDLHKKLNIIDNTSKESKRYIIANWEGEPVGIEVDAICDILTVLDDEISSVPSNLSSKISEFFESVFHKDDKIIGILDIDALLGIYNE